MVATGDQAVWGLHINCPRCQAKNSGTLLRSVSRKTPSVSLETIVLGNRGEKGLSRVPLQGLLLTEIMRCLRASAPDVGSGYKKSDTLAGNLVRQTKTLIPETREAAISMQKDIRAIMNVCPEDIKRV